MTTGTGAPAPGGFTSRIDQPPTVGSRATRALTGAVWLVVLSSGAAAVAVHRHPTANRVSDVVLALLVGAAVVVAASLAEPRARLAASLIALGATSGVWIAVAGVGVVLSATGVRRPEARARSVLGAVVGMAVVQVLLRLPADRFGLNTILSALAIGCLLRSAWTRSRSPHRARARQVSIIVGGGAAACLLGFGLALLLSRNAIQSGIERADQGLEAARAGDSDAAADRLDEASRAFASAHDNLDAWWAKPALLLPGVGQHVRALEVLTAEGSRLATASATSARAARVQDLRVTDGRLDLDRVRSMAAPLASISAALGRAARGVPRAESPWLVAPVAARIAAFERSIDAAIQDTATAMDAVEVLPDVLGGSGPRRYFVAFGTPSEARDLGGFMGAYAILKADDGELSLRSTGRVNDLNERFRGRRLTDRSPFPDHYLALLPQKFWQNITGSADFPTVAEAVHQMWKPPAAPVDGVLYMDPEALATMLKLTGPITLPGLSRPLTARTAAPFLLRDQYIEFPDDDRHDFLVDAATKVFRQLTSGDLPGPRALADTLAPAVHERRLLFNSFHAGEQDLFERLNLDGALPPVQGDFLSVRASNRGRSKIDAFMQRTVTYDVSADPTSNTVHATVTVTVQNDAPASGLPYPVIGNHLDRPSGTSSTTVSVYTPLGLTDVTMDDESIGRGADEEYGRNRYSALLDVPPGDSRTVTFELEGAMDLRAGYHLDLVPQPLVNPDRFRVHVTGPAGWGWGGRSAFVRPLREDTSMDVSFFPFTARGVRVL